MSNGRTSSMPGSHPALPGAAVVLGLLIMAAVVVFPLWVWFFCRIEPGPGKIAVLMRKTGKNLESGQIVAMEPGQKGVQLEVLGEGRYWRNPYTWTWWMANITDVPPGMVGVVTRLYGKDLPAGRIIAGPNEKGILADVLGPGKYRINPFAFSVALHPAINIRAGHVGVVTSLIGADPLGDELPHEERNQFLVAKGMKGVQPEVLDPGTHYLNPYMYHVVEVNLQSQRFEMSGEDAISFLTMDGFNVTVEGTIEFAVQGTNAALLTHRVGDMDDIVQKIILPRARGFSRIEGSKKPAINYIVGESRQEFQDNLEAHLMQQCARWGVTVKSVLIRNIKVPEQIASIIRDREVAVQNARKFEQQIEQAKSKAELTRQEMLAIQNREKVEAQTEAIRAVIAAEQEQVVARTAAEKDMAVAALENDAAGFQADAIRLQAEAERDVIRMNNEAQASVFAAQVKAFGNGMNLARYVFYQRLAPKVRSILGNDSQDGLGGLFAPYLPERKEIRK